jgi:hypothetical protein
MAPNDSQSSFTLASAAVGVVMYAQTIYKALFNAKWDQGRMAWQVEEMEVYVYLLEEAANCLLKTPGQFERSS